MLCTLIGDNHEVMRQQNMVIIANLLRKVSILYTSDCEMYNNYLKHGGIAVKFECQVCY